MRPPHHVIICAAQTPVQKWQSKDVTSVSSEKSKHVSIDIDGPSGPTTLHLHTESKDHVEQIIAKVQSSKALSANDGESSSPPQSAVDSKKPSVHFSQTSPVIIPSGPAHEDKEDTDEEQEEEEEEDHAPQPHPAAGLTQEMAVALYDFDADGDDELSVVEGEKLTILEKDGDEWWKCKNAKGAIGVVPASYLEVCYLPTMTVDWHAELCLGCRRQCSFSCPSAEKSTSC